MSISTLADIVRHQAAAQPARIALTFEDRNTNYAALDRRANQVANGLLAACVRGHGSQCSTRTTIVSSRSGRRRQGKGGAGAGKLATGRTGDLLSRHDRFRRREHLPGRGGEWALWSPGHRRCRRDRRAGRAPGEAVKAIVVLKPGQNTSATEVVAYARERIAGYKLPKSIDFTDDLPRNPSGKILKRELRERYWRGQTRRVH